MKIGIDVDGVICDLMSAILQRNNKCHRENVKLSDITDWDTHKFLGCGHQVYGIGYIADPSIYRNEVREIHNSLESVNTLREKHTIYFISACMPSTIEEKIMWLRFHGYMESTSEFISCYDKHMINVDILIDDRFDNVKNFPGKSILFSQPWNKKYQKDVKNGVEVAENWGKVLEIVEKIDYKHREKEML